MAAALDVQRLVDRLGAHPHLRPFGKPLGEVEADLLRAPLHTQLRLHHGRQLKVVELAGLRPPAPQLGLLRGRRPKASKFDHLELAAVVQSKLCVKWSPEQISLHLAERFPERAEMRVCPETIYQALYVQGRGHLRADLHRHLRTGRAVRRPRGSSVTKRGKIPNMILISERPAEVADRAISGHWEGDLIVGSNCRSAIGTLVERQFDPTIKSPSQCPG